MPRTTDPPRGLWSICASVRDGVRGWRVRTRHGAHQHHWFIDEDEAREVCASCNAGLSLEVAIAHLHARLDAASSLAYRASRRQP